MVILLLLVPLIMLFCILFLGVYTPLIFFFIIISFIVPPIIFKYRYYPHRSIYAFLFLWIVFPKYIRYIPIIGTYYLTGISYFDILQTLSVLHIIILLIMKSYGKRKKIIIPKSLLFLTNIFFATILITTIAGIIRYFFFDLSFPLKISDGNLLDFFVNPFYGIIVLLGLCAFIVNYKQVETLLAILAISGILLLTEHLIMSYLGFFSNMNVWAYASDKLRFSSLIFSSYDLKGLFCVISTFAILYFVIQKRMYYLLPLALLMIFPIQVTYQRTIYLGYSFGILAFILIYLHRIKLMTRFVVLYLVLVSLIIVIGNSKETYENVNTFIIGDVRTENKFTNSKSLYDRIGLWFRSADVFIYSFPFGVGEGMAESYYGASFVPATMTPLVLSSSKSAYQAISGPRQTKAHNVYIQFIAEYNILGLFVLFLFIIQILKNFMKSGLDNRIPEYTVYRATVYAMITSIGIMNLFESAARLFFMYGMLLFFTYLSSNLMIEKTINKNN
ncbi:MAG: O-antigen ligase family protein [Spirochaetia bacterium]|nr:O-antigen ligase family protein [Spirochaetia bacterium]